MNSNYSFILCWVVVARQRDDKFCTMRDATVDKSLDIRKTMRCVEFSFK